MLFHRSEGRDSSSSPDTADHLTLLFPLIYFDPELGRIRETLVQEKPSLFPKETLVSNTHYQLKHVSRVRMGRTMRSFGHSSVCF